MIRMKRLWYDSEALGLESVGLRDLQRAHFSLRTSPALEPERLLQKESTWLTVKVSLWTQVHVMWPVSECTHSKPTRLAGLWPFPAACDPKAKVRLWTGPFCAQGQFWYCSTAEVASPKWSCDQEWYSTQISTSVGSISVTVNANRRNLR